MGLVLFIYFRFMSGLSRSCCRWPESKKWFSVLVGFSRLRSLALYSNSSVRARAALCNSVLFWRYVLSNRFAEKIVIESQSSGQFSFNNISKRTKNYPVTRGSVNEPSTQMFTRAHPFQPELPLHLPVSLTLGFCTPFRVSRVVCGELFPCACTVGYAAAFAVNAALVASQLQHSTWWTVPVPLHPPQRRARGLSIFNKIIHIRLKVFWSMGFG